MGSKQSKQRSIKPPPTAPRPENLSDLPKRSPPSPIPRFASTGSSITPMSPSVLSTSTMSELSYGRSTSATFNKSVSVLSENPSSCERRSRNSMSDRHLPVPPEVEPEKRRLIVVALQNFSKDNKNDLEFFKNDKMIITSKDDPDWWYAEHLTTHQKGFIPSELVADEDADDRHEWFHKTDRSGCRRLLLCENCPVGTFMVRKKETGELALSIKNRMNNNTHNFELARVRHYKIRQANNRYHLNNRVTFKSLLELVQYYQGGSHGLICRLEEPCPKEPIYFPLYPKLRDRFEVSPDEFEMIGDKPLGSGQFGEVWRAVWKEWGGLVAIKKLIGTKELKDDDKQEFLNEATIMKRCNHRNVVKLHAFCTQSTPYYIVTEFVENGDLKKYLKKHKNIAVSTLINMAVQVASGMDYLSKIPLIHRDLAARNVLVAAQGLVKVADFGMARRLTSAEYCSQKNQLKPVKWTAPEALMQNIYSCKSDVWSFGILLVEIITRGQTPYPNLTGYEEHCRYLHGGDVHERPAQCPQGLYEIMLTCWAFEANDRSDFKTLFSRLGDYETSLDDGLESAAPAARSTDEIVDNYAETGSWS